MRKDVIEIRSWEELVEARSDQFNLEVDVFTGSARILDLNGDVVFYLSTHSFYEGYIEKSNEALRYFGFNALLVRDEGSVERKYTVNSDNFESFLKAFEENVYPVIKENGGVAKLEEAVAKRRKQVNENKMKREEIARSREKEGN